MKLDISLVYDNHPTQSAVKADWGFACLVKAGEKTVLFDTGGDSRILLDNMNAMNLDPVAIDAVVLSHLHPDHTGGLSGLLQVNSRCDVYIPFPPNHFAEVFKDHSGEIVNVNTDATIASGLCVAAHDDALALYVNVEGILLVLASRIPEKMLKMLGKVKTTVPRKIDLLIAGFCFFSSEVPEKLIESFKDLGVRRIAPCHCCPTHVREVFATQYGEDYTPFMLGNVLQLCSLIDTTRIDNHD